MRTMLALILTLALWPTAALALTVQDVIALSKAGLSDEVIVALIERDRPVFTIDPDRLIAEKGLGVMSDGVEGAIVDVCALVESTQKRQDMALRCRDHVGRFHTGAAAVAVVDRALSNRSEAALETFQIAERS